MALTLLTESILSWYWAYRDLHVTMLLISNTIIGPKKVIIDLYLQKYNSNCNVNMLKCCAILENI